MNKSYHWWILTLLWVSLLGLLSACDKTPESSGPEIVHGDHAHQDVKTYYTCSMHPQIKQDGPGKCPICHMTLTKVEVDPEDEAEVVSTVKTNSDSADKELWYCENYPDVTSEKADTCPIDGTPMVKLTLLDKAGDIVGKIKLRKSQLQHFKPDFFPTTYMKMSKKIRLLGTVLPSEERESNIPARIGGRVEKVYIKSTGSFIKEGDPVIDYYSPQLITAGEEYLLARKSFERDKSKEFKDLLQQSEERLKLWGIRPSQYDRWYKQQSVPRSITIYSPATGIVQQRNAVVGKYFNEGQNFFELSDLKSIWVEMDVYEHDAALVHMGQNVRLEFSALPGEIYTGEIDFVHPVMDPKSRTLKVRTTIANPKGKLRPGMVADGMLEVELEGEPLVIPRSAVIDTGKRKVVWVKVNDKQFQAKTILTGFESEGYVEVKSGLMEGEEVVVEGNFLLDAQAQLFGGYEDVSKPGAGGHQH